MTTFDLTEAAAFLHMHKNTVQERARSGEIPGAKPGRAWVFIKEDLEVYQAQVERERNKHEKDNMVIEKLLDEAIGVPTDPCVYFLFRRKSLVYIGQTINLLGRLAHHVRTKSFDSYAFVPCAREDLDGFEARLIAHFQPVLNEKLK